MGIADVNGALGVHGNSLGATVWGMGASVKAPGGFGGPQHEWLDLPEARCVALMTAASDRPAFEAAMDGTEAAWYGALPSAAQDAIWATAKVKHDLGLPYR
jgi:hypothetical protein